MKTKNTVLIFVTAMIVIAIILVVKECTYKGEQKMRDTQGKEFVKPEKK